MSEENSKSYRSDKPAKEQPQDPNRQVSATPTKPQFPPPADGHRAPDNKSKECKGWYEPARFWLESVGLLVLICYTTFAALQWRETQKAAEAAKLSADAAIHAANIADATLKASERSFQIDQRPYIVTDAPQFVKPPAADNQLVAVNVFFRNIGRTPAIKVINQIKMPMFRPSKTSRKKLLIFLKNAFTSLREKFKGGGEYAPLARRDIAPGATTFSTAEATATLSAQDVENLKEGSLTIFCVGISQYSDAFGGNYETEFCYFYFGNDPKIWHICDSHNVIK